MSQDGPKPEATRVRELNVRAAVKQLQSPSARLVYLAAVGEATLDELCNKLALTRLALFPLLRKLKSNGLIIENQGIHTTANQYYFDNVHDRCTVWNSGS